MNRLAIVGCLFVGQLCSQGSAAPPGPGYHPRVKVTAPTRLDWTFVLANQSQAKPPVKWVENYDSTKQSYELFVPARRNPKQLLPVILFVSPGKGPAGWKQFEKTAKAQGILFASPFDAGNDCPSPRRVRIVLDVLDDLRRNYPIDPDRCYIGGFSGGGRIACAIGFAMPELFGGVMPVCAGGALRQESWLRQRATDRLSVPLLTGETDFNRGEVERLRTTYFKELGVRSKSWTQPGLGHAIPGDKILTEAYRWLEAGLPGRQKVAKQFPFSRLPAKAESSREVMSKNLFAEGKKRLTEKGQLYAGLMLLKGVMERWPDLPEAAPARKILEEQETKKDRTWEKDDLAEQRRFLIAQAKALDAYAMGSLPAVYEKQRKQMITQTIELWKQIASDQPNSEIAKLAKQRIVVLTKKLDD